MVELVEFLSGGKGAACRQAAKGDAVESNPFKAILLRGMTRYLIPYSVRPD